MQAEKSPQTKDGDGVGAVEPSPPHTSKSSGDVEPDLSNISHAQERALVHKLDYYIIPIIMMLYLCSFLDRGMCLFFSRLSPWLTPPLLSTG